MKNVFVRSVEHLGWELLTFENWGEVEVEFKKREIFIHRSTNLGSFIRIWNGVQIGKNSVIGSNCFLGVKTQIKQNVYIGENCIIDSHTIIENDSQIDSYSTVGTRCKIAPNTQIGVRSYIGAYTETQDFEIVKCFSANLGKHTLYYWGHDRIEIGCKSYPVDEWIRRFEGIGEANRYPSKIIAEYGEVMRMIQSFRQTFNPAPTAPAPLGTDLPAGDIVTFRGANQIELPMIENPDFGGELNPEEY